MGHGLSCALPDVVEDALSWKAANFATRDMTGPLRTQALSQLTNEDLAAMLTENETLFVEHKGNLRQEGDAYSQGDFGICQHSWGLGSHRSDEQRVERRQRRWVGTGFAARAGVRGGCMKVCRYARGRTRGTVWLSAGS